MENITTVRLFDLEQRVRALEEMMSRDIWAESHFERRLVEEYGMCVTKSTAASILKVCRETIYNMLNDGRLVSTKDGSRVDTRSIARYMSAMSQGASGDDC